MKYWQAIRRHPEVKFADPVSIVMPRWGALPFEWPMLAGFSVEYWSAGSNGLHLQCQIIKGACSSGMSSPPEAVF